MSDEQQVHEFAQAQHVETFAKLAVAEARLEAVKALCDAVGSGARQAWSPMQIARFVNDVRAALSVAPQPQPGTKTTAELLREVARRDPEGHNAALARGYGGDRDPAYYPEPPASAEPVPDLMQALRASVEAAKKSRG